MEKGQIDNLIHFCFNFHKTMDNYFVNSDPTYIIEKWNKYIGFKPNERDVELSQDPMTDWIVKWKVDIKQYDVLKEIIDFIIKVNKKHFFPRGLEADENDPSNHIKPNMVWSVSELVELFEENIGSSESINEFEYRHTHHVIENAIQNWLSNTQIKRDYNLILLKIK
jgi:hypothetical protein